MLCMGDRRKRRAQESGEAFACLLSYIVQSFHTLLEYASDSTVIFSGREVLLESWQHSSMGSQGLDNGREPLNASHAYPGANISTLIGGVIS